MSKPNKDARPTPRLPRGLRDIEAAELRQQQDMLAKIRAVYELYGFEPLETPAFEYTDALGKFLPDQDRPNAGVFSFQDSNEVRGKADAEEWMSLRYDLTAPLARYVAQNYQDMPKPFRRYAVGPVWRNEKPGPGRFRQFMQFDADTVGAESVAADAEMCMLAADTLEALGIKRGDYVIKVNNRKVLDGIRLETGIESDSQWLTTLRAIDKLDRIGINGVRALLGERRTDESGDITEGAKLTSLDIERVISYIERGLGNLDQFGARLTKIAKASALGLKQLRALTHAGAPEKKDRPAALTEDQIDLLLAVFRPKATIFDFAEDVIEDDIVAVVEVDDEVLDVPVTNLSTINRLRSLPVSNPLFIEGVNELEQLSGFAHAAGYGTQRLRIDPTVVRGLEYYTGPVFEAELTFEVKDEKGRPVRFGSVGGGGRYDDLVARFTGQKVPATGFSIGVSRLQAALAALNKDKAVAADGPVIVTVMEKERIADYQKMVQALRTAGIRAELYLGNPKKFGKQLEYADKRGSPCVVIQGSDERAKDEVTLKDLVEGAKAAAAITDNAAWKEARPAQVSVKEADLVAEVRKILARHST